MEDGENGAKRLWNGYTREKMSIFLREKSMKKWKMAWNGSSDELFELWLSRFESLVWDKSIGDKLSRPNLVKKNILKGSAGQKKSKISRGGYKLYVAKL